MKLLLALYEYTVDPTRSDRLSFIINHFVRGLTPAGEREIMYRISRTESDPLEIIRSAAEGSEEAASSELEALVELLRYLRQLKTEKNALGLLETIVSKTGILSGLIRDGAIIDKSSLIEVAAILRSAEAFVKGGEDYTHSDFIEFREWKAGFGDNDESEEIQTRVVLQTVHGSKGLEYPAVFVMGLSNRRFPSSQKSALVEFPPELYKDELPEGDYRIQEERRLFYVAMTRAREKLYLYGIEKKGTKRSRFLTELEATPFFAESCGLEKVAARVLPGIEKFGPARARDDSKSVIIPVKEDIENCLADGLMRIWNIYGAKAGSPDEFIELKEKFDKQLQSSLSTLQRLLQRDDFKSIKPAERYTVDKISYTDLEAFDACPLQFYYRKILRIPSPTSPHQMLGQVIHAVLENGVRMMMRGIPADLDSLVADFHSRWKKIRLGDPDQKERMGQRGAELLAEFIRMQDELIGIPAELEKFFEIELNSAKLVGRIDRVNKSPEGLTVIDYKTGNKGSKKLDDDLQLPIYSLACKELFREYPVDTMIMFLGDGQIHRASIDAETLEEVKTQIEEKIAAINESEFGATPGNPCRTCEYAGICPAKAG